MMQFVEPAVVTTQFQLRPGDVVADFGAGGGYFLAPLSAAVGRDGVVYAIDIQKNLVTTLGEQVRERGLDNVRVIWADLEEVNGTTLETSALDVAIMVNTLFQFEDKAGGLAEVVRTLRPGGKFFCIDWSESFNNLGPTPDAVVPPDRMRALAEAAGLVYERDYPAGAHHYGFAFRKP